MVVIGIIGILAAIALSFSLSSRKKAADARSRTDVQEVLKGWAVYSNDSSQYLSLCSGILVLDVINVTGAPSLSADLIPANLIGSNVDFSQIVASSATDGVAQTCVYNSGVFTATSIAVGKQMQVTSVADPSNALYPHNSVGGAIDAVFDTPAAGPYGTNVWYVSSIH